MFEALPRDAVEYRIGAIGLCEMSPDGCSLEAREMRAVRAIELTIEESRGRCAATIRK